MITALRRAIGTVIGIGLFMATVEIPAKWIAVIIIGVSLAIIAAILIFDLGRDGTDE